MDKFCSEIKHLIKIGDIPPIKFTSEIREGVPEDVINSYAKQIHPTSIIMGTRGYGKKEKVALQQKSLIRVAILCFLSLKMLH